MKIYKIAEWGEEQALEGLPKGYKSHLSGSCDLAVEYVARHLLSKGMSDFIIVEGHVKPLYDNEWKEAHTWIEKGGQIIDPTKEQYGIEIDYIGPRKEYNPEAYLEYTSNFQDQIEEDKKKFLD